MKTTLRRAVFHSGGLACKACTETIASRALWLHAAIGAHYRPDVVEGVAFCLAHDVLEAERRGAHVPLFGFRPPVAPESQPVTVA